MAHLNAHYDNIRWLEQQGERLAAYTTDDMILTLDIVSAGRRFRLDPEKLLRIKNLAEIAGYLHNEEEETGMMKIVTVANSIGQMYEMAFPRDETEPEIPNAGEAVQPVPRAKTGK